MAQSMTPSAVITAGQIDKAASIFRAKLEKHRSELPSEAVQLVLGQEELGSELFGVFRKRVDAIGETYTATVNYDDPQWRTINHDYYAYVGNVTVADYPVTETGTKKIHFRELEFEYNPTDQEVLDRMAELNCRQPNRAEAETVIRGYTTKQLRDHPRIGLIGPAVPRRGCLRRACVDNHGPGVRLHWHWTGARWVRLCRFVAVCK